MKKNKVILIAFLMGAALTGLTILQVNWIRHDFAIRQERFRQQVNIALNNAVSKLETTESVMILTNKVPGILNDSALTFFRNHPPLPPPDPPPAPDPVGMPFPPGISEKEMRDIEVRIMSEENNIRAGKKKLMQPGRKQLLKKRQVILHSETDSANENLLTENDSQVIIIDNENSEIINVQKEIRKATNDLNRQKAQLKREKITKVFEKMAYEYEIRNYALLERINPLIVDSIVHTELLNNGINIPYSISLNNGISDSSVWKRNTPGDGKSNQVFKTSLFPGDILSRRDYIQLSFPDTFSYLLSSMWLMVLSSAVFTIIIILTFSYTVYVIFRQKKLSEMKNDFINNMTHEFKTPIATIRLASDAIINPGVITDSEKVSYYSRIIRDENERMNSHVEKILQMAQFDRNAFVPVFQATDMHEVISNAINKFRLQVEEKGGSIKFNAAAESPFVKADPAFIPFVILNLIDNSVKYNDSIPIITIDTSNTASELIIKVQDNGIGLDKETQQRIFEKFYRATSGNIHNVKGFGLGLNYVKAIVTAHGGTIEVSSERGRGALFTIKLPLAKL
jgi:two-component system, OmpR family, phosphate regulon sensor histidine kinase PhoR